ncbi:UDP-N-acetylglucosamine diphosphorylase/glucosamine-1-phosphate N-acetyltransferase [Leucobacter sp. OLJS4]|uniref:bifunctional UDP-N-acetylglucosamine diphosphorylase/glucosamine-1-phosphate N-acetyltransferase GlmU n=1 Tax=unclassified Leucobacter TaxID=2621730 RepID=UPI000C1A14F0|nr:MULTISPECIES: bifunctional UDP-N-acetylglucosamine diphosphorylase/glucosamine-1-phosphate N-acetyltransferase GlmU [unclassified Leucobacter]PII87579.1 UDP-N-acetylglucosamine diphosphorylase/glucosamine-1-phosphate N-acetyltransferase [Leucobacter sp. OLCALW19]PII93305.1 UDP-N-acetylglucosamine diphosphorylase/glucosamine-1-phosphate N-acetyltransferase [Leucobacter sp. OLAS13]PII96437.1 UDP-N-acetylglucosamine diphosphorylase/glucosamine-1-phosphate N-acetyltransferase [Leucobacter sp. OLT
MTNQLAVVILAAGQGTRMKSATPKVLHPIGGRSLIAHVLDTAAGLDPQTVVAVVRHERERVAAAILDHAPHTRIVDQDAIPGTGRAVEQAVEALPADFDGSIVVLSGDVPLIDVPTLQRLVDGHVGGGRSMTLLSAIYENPTGLGRILRGADGLVTGIVEEKDADDAQRRITEINGGIYVFARPALERALAGIDTNNAQGEKYLTDAAAAILAEGGAVEAVATDDPWLIAGVNDRAQLSDAGVEMNRRIVRAHQRAGVTIQDPATTWIDADVSIEPDVEILPGTFLRGATSIATGAIVGPDTTLVDCEVGEGARIRRSEATLAVFGAGVEVGPYSFVRPGTELGAKGKIGAFVETKNAKIGEASKVPHLSYVGDATIGRETNVGAGTIVANYDGVNKHQTVVGDAVRIGSKNVLIAPVTIEDGVYTAAGALIRKNVPSGSLAMTVAPQRNIEGWVAEHRPGTNTAAAAEKNGEQQA